MINLTPDSNLHDCVSFMRCKQREYLTLYNTFSSLSETIALENERIAAAKDKLAKLIRQLEDCRKRLEQNRKDREEAAKLDDAIKRARDELNYLNGDIAGLEKALKECNERPIVPPAVISDVRRHCRVIDNTTLFQLQPEVRYHLQGSGWASDVNIDVGYFPSRGASAHLVNVHYESGRFGDCGHGRELGSTIILAHPDGHVKHPSRWGGRIRAVSLNTDYYFPEAVCFKSNTHIILGGNLLCVEYANLINAEPPLSGTTFTLAAVSGKPCCGGK